jgi:hypothetical protein
MAGRTRRWVWLLVTRAALLLAAIVTTIYVSGPPLITTLLHRRVSQPDAEDYAVYSAFVDGFFSSNQPFKADQSVSTHSVVYMVGETLSMRNTDSILPLEVAVLGPEDMGEDFFRQNAHSWPLELRFHTELRISIVGHDMAYRAASAGAEKLFHPTARGDLSQSLLHASPDGPFPEAPYVSGVLQLSRAGFNRRRTLALLHYTYRCGVLCGQSGWVVLHKKRGCWRIERFGSGVVY